MDAEITNLLEQRLIRELGEIKRKIMDLQHEQAAVERMLLKVRREGIAATSVARCQATRQTAPLTP